MITEILMEWDMVRLFLLLSGLFVRLLSVLLTSLATFSGKGKMGAGKVQRQGRQNNQGGFSGGYEDSQDKVLFLPTAPQDGPVALTPSWEERSLPPEQLNFQDVGGDFEATKEPIDKYHLVYLIFILHGVGSLMPWNMFITAKEYFVNYKLNATSESADTIYSTYFLNYLGFAAQVPNLLFNWINVFVHMGGDLTRRVVWSLLFSTAIFILTIILSILDSSGWIPIFFWVTIVSVVLLNISNGIYQNTVYGMAAKLPFKFTGGVVLGSNISGTFTSIINILSIALAPNPRTAGIYYFIVALFVLLACLDTYFALPLLKFYRYFDNIDQRRQAMRRNMHSSVHGHSKAWLYWHIFKTAFPQLFNVFLVFFVTLSIFPVVHADIRPMDENFFISPTYFTPITCFLTFNTCAMLGNLLPHFFVWPSPKWLWLPVCLRIFMIPYFVLCNYHPVAVKRILPVLITNDYAYWVMAILMGLTSGYFSSLAMMYSPRTVEPEHAGTAGMFAAAALITGICLGINFSLVLAWFVQTVTFDYP